MSNISKFETIGTLLQKYGRLLTDHQSMVMERYYFYDLTMQEIAEQLKITRSAVSEVIKQSLDKLREYEAKLNLLQRDEQILVLLAQLEIKSDNQEQLVQQIRDILTNGI